MLEFIQIIFVLHVIHGSIFDTICHTNNVNLLLSFLFSEVDRIWIGLTYGVDIEHKVLQMHQWECMVEGEGEVIFFMFEMRVFVLKSCGYCGLWIL